MKPIAVTGNEDLVFDVIDGPDGPIRIARVGPSGYALHEPMFQSPVQNRKDRRRAAVLARRKR